MASIRGRYEYDDDALTPGKRKEGGLHQNLFDAEGNLRANARFIPDEGTDGEPAPWQTATTQAEVEEAARLAREEREQMEAFVQQVLVPLLAVAIQRGAPYAQRLWREKARPALRARLDRLTRRRGARRRRDQEEPATLEGVVVEAVDMPKVDMAASEAEARRLLAMALRRASDEQMRLLEHASVVADDQSLEDAQLLPVSSTGDVASLLGRVSAQPAALSGDEVLTTLHLLLGVPLGDRRELT